MIDRTIYRQKLVFNIFVFITAFVMLGISSSTYATMLNLSFTGLRGEFSSFDIPDGAGGTISTGTWIIEQNGPGTWNFDTTTGINTFTVDERATFPDLPIALAAQLAIVETGGFMFASEDATGITGVWAANTGFGTVSAPGTPLDGIVFSFNNQNNLSSIMPAFPPFPPAVPMLAAAPIGFTALAADTLPLVNALETRGMFSLSGVLDIPGIPNQQTFQGTGSYTLIPAAVPEPSIVALWGIGFVVFFVSKSHRKPLTVSS